MTAIGSVRLKNAQSRLAGACLLAVLAGSLATLGWAPFGCWPLALAAFAVLFRLVQGAASAWRAGWIGVSFGLGLHLFGHGWVYTALHAQAGLGSVAAALSTLLVLLYLASFIAVPCALARAGAGWFESRRRTASRRLQAASRILAYAGLLTLGEWARSLFFNGFTSLSLGYSLLDTWLAGYIPAGGLYLETWVALLICGVLASAWDASPSNRAVGLLVALLFVAVGWGLGRISWIEPSGPALSYRLIQSNIPQRRKFDPSHVRSQSRRLVELIEQAPADLIVTPETAFPLFLNQLPADTLARLQQFSRRSGSHVYIGMAIASASSDGYNSMLQLSPEGGPAVARYDKMRLMPFGEYSPSGFDWFTRSLAIPLKDMSAGAADQPPFTAKLRGNIQTIGTLICHEDLIGRDARQRAASSGLLLNPSNLAWFDGGPAIAQRLQIARMRAREVARPILRVANTGITAHIDFDATVVSQLAAGDDGVLSGMLQPTRGATLYARAGDALAVSLCLLGLLLNCLPGAATRVSGEAARASAG